MVASAWWWMMMMMQKSLEAERGVEGYLSREANATTNSTLHSGTSVVRRATRLLEAGGDSDGKVHIAEITGGALRVCDVTRALVCSKGVRRGRGEDQ
jgi:hypothetical protein